MCRTGRLEAPWERRPVPEMRRAWQLAGACGGADGPTGDNMSYDIPDDRLARFNQTLDEFVIGAALAGRGVTSDGHSARRRVLDVVREIAREAYNDGVEARAVGRAATRQETP